MSPLRNLKVIVGLGLLLLGGLVVGWLFTQESEPVVVEVVEEPTPKPFVHQAVIGRSVEDREIEVYEFGHGSTTLLFVGGIHGGYEWNSVLLAYQFIDHVKANPGLVPDDIKIGVIPNANPDGVVAVVGKEGRFASADIPESADTAVGRFNANKVDLNRNFDCKWQPESSWRGQTVSAGTAAFSEPEAATLRDYILKAQPAAVTFWHSKANNVYASECEEGVLPVTLDIMQTYADAASYGAVPVFDAYPITGDAEGWLASIGIPAITVELSTHETLDWERNLAGVKALVTYFDNKAVGL